MTTETGASIARGLLDSLRAEFGRPSIEFAEGPTEIGGGFDTRIFGFRLSNVPAPLAGPLILRLLAAHHPPGRALRERAIQNEVAAQGYPAPRVFLTSTETASLGGAWLVMERAAGRPLLGAQFLNLSGAIADAQRRLHMLDAEGLRRAIEAEGQSARALTLDGLLARFDARVAAGPLDGLRPAMAWLAGRRPPERRPVICHGDFHPQNILTAGGTITAVLDWPNCVIADAEYDVAATRVILSFAPVGLTSLAAPARALVRLLRPVLARRYLSCYRRARPLDDDALAYYEALACMRALLRAAESRLRIAAGPPNPLDASTFADELAAHFARITGVVAALPAAQGPHS
jgi:aminoglycoside phosphotransferase (APT) family kinase protein